MCLPVFIGRSLLSPSSAFCREPPTFSLLIEIKETIMQHKKLAVPMLAVALTAAIWGFAALAEDKVVTDQVLATVNGEDIKKSDLEAYLHSKGPEAAAATNPNALLEELVHRELLKQEAEKQGMDKEVNFQKAMELERTNLLVNGLLNDTIDSTDLSDEALKKEYDEQIKNGDMSEYKARHILLKSEDDAKAVIKQLDDGADFATLAIEKSTGPSGPSGGDLGWFQAGSMVKEFADAIEKLKVGSFTKNPVKTQFGWHVIKLDEKRKIDPPGFEESKNQVKNILANKAIQSYIQKLQSQAKIEVKKQN